MLILPDCINPSNIRLTVYVYDHVKKPNVTLEKLEPDNVFALKIMKTIV